MSIDVSEALEDIQTLSCVDSYDLTNPNGREDALGSLIEARERLDGVIERLQELVDAD